MRAEVAALRAVLASLGMPTFWGRVNRDLTQADYPYLLVWQSTGRPFDEVPLDGRNRAWSAVIGITTVGATTDSAVTKAREVSALLTPDGYPLDLPVAGRAVTVAWEAFGAMQEDRDVAIPGAPKPGYPMTYVDLYRLTSLPV